MPGAFINALAESVVAPQVGRCILDTACKVAARWQAQGPGTVRVGVNLFPVQFQQAVLVDEVRAALERTRLPPGALELEITENIAIGRDNVVLPSLRKLRKLGVGIAFDDFGTGYASLSYLTQYPLTRIKIDRSFIQKIGRHPALEESAIIFAIISLGHNLGLEVIAEGVETEGQVALLKAKECDEVQGYFYGKPMSASEFELLLQRDQTVSTEMKQPASFSTPRRRSC